MLICNKSEIGAGTRGASLGVDALILTALSRGSSFISSLPTISVNDRNHVLYQPNTHQWARYIDALVPVYEEVCRITNTVLKEGKFPILVSGDHASAGGTVAGIKSAFPDKRIGIVWIDAHADLHSPYTSPSGNTHGMPLAAIFNEDNKKFDPGDVKVQTEIEWQKLKSIGVTGPKARPDDLVFIGVRDTEKEEDYLIDKFAIKNYRPAYFREIGVSKMILEIKDKLKHCELVYISFDVDCLDSKMVSQGTGTPVKDGILVHEAKEILKSLMSWEKVCCLEVTEINPLLDQRNSMAETALGILEYSLGIEMDLKKLAT